MSASPDPVRPVAAAAGPRTILSGNALGMASMLAWACGFPAADILLIGWTPLGLITVRFALAVAVLVPLWIALDGPRAVIGARWGRGTLVGGLTFGLGAWLMLVAQALTDAVTVAVIASATPIAATLVELAARQRQLRARFAAGLALSVAGGILATGAGGAWSGPSLGPGALAAVSSCFLFAIGSHATVRDFPGVSPLGRATLTLAGGFVLTACLTLVLEGTGRQVLPLDAPRGADWLHLAIYAVAGMALSQVMWIMSVGRLGVAVAAFHINIAPFYVMLLMAALGAGWSWAKAAGATVVIAGVVLAQGKSRRQMFRARNI